MKVSSYGMLLKLDRARSLISELTLDEKIQLMGNEASGIKRLHIPDYQCGQKHFMELGNRLELSLIQRLRNLQLNH